ncbi:MAG: hypothetical protein ABR899_11385 [Candidatus Krumholzibacteriaceae bacterium]|jgi:hypothetical protein
MSPKRFSLAAIGVVLCTAALAIMLGFSGHAQQAGTKGRMVVTDSMKQAWSANAAALLKAECVNCHGGAHPKMQLNLEAAKLPGSVSDVASREIDSLKLVDTKRPQMSYLVWKVRGAAGIKGARMPLDEPALAADNLRTIGIWARSLSSLPWPERRHVRDTTRAHKS